VLAPGPEDRPLQYIDARDLAIWMLAAADRGLGGAFNVVSQSGHATMSSLLESGRAVTKSDAELIWVTPEEIEEAEIQAWTDLPIWAPRTGELAGLHDGDVSAAYREGLSCRAVEETVADTWDWMVTEGERPPPDRYPPLGLDHDRERAVLQRHFVR
jgi:hypothetical protein